MHGYYRAIWFPKVILHLIYRKPLYSRFYIRNLGMNAAFNKSVLLGNIKLHFNLHFSAMIALLLIISKNYLVRKISAMYYMLPYVHV